MISDAYRAQADLLLQILPFVAQEECFALKGGTAINFFVRELARYSVDIDLSYLPFDDRNTALQNISDALGRTKARLERAFPDLQVKILPQSDGQEAKLLCKNQFAQVKIEVNTTIRGHIYQPRLMQVTERVETEFGKFAQIKVISEAELFGGKICAALDRQHPRDLFDIHLLLENEGFSDEIRRGFITLLISNSRPINELISPNLLDQRATFDTQFAGMTMIPFSYEDYEAARERLIAEIHEKLTEEDREFLISFKKGEPNWDLISLPTLKDMPAVKWKLINIRKLIKQDPKKHAKALSLLEQVLSV
jgi:predicted nucleotidyltransferase component of viral defense system